MSFSYDDWKKKFDNRKVKPIIPFNECAKQFLTKSIIEKLNDQFSYAYRNDEYPSKMIYVNSSISTCSNYPTNYEIIEKNIISDVFDSKNIQGLKVTDIKHDSKYLNIYFIKYDSKY